MRKIATYLATGLAIVGLTSVLTATPAAADPAPIPDTGLVFYVSPPLTVVARQAAPDGLCHAFPATATTLLAWSNFSNVIGYRSADCSDAPIALGIFRGFTTPGIFASYKAI